MSGGPNVSTPRYLERFTCQVDRCGDEIEESESTSCFHVGCYRQILCVGCSYDCVDCTEHQGHTFCAEHICQTPAGQGMVEYRCVQCQALHDNATEKAA